MKLDEIVKELQAKAQKLRTREAHVDGLRVGCGGDEEARDHRERCLGLAATSLEAACGEIEDAKSELAELNKRDGRDEGVIE